MARRDKVKPVPNALFNRLMNDPFYNLDLVLLFDFFLF